jgi:hypothetical protein
LSIRDVELYNHFLRVSRVHGRHKLKMKQGRNLLNYLARPHRTSYPP